MRKITLFFCLILMSISFYGCAKYVGKIVNDSLSEVRYNLYQVYTNEIDIQFTSGFREEPYIINGISESKKEFGIITAHFLFDIKDYSGLPTFNIKINEREFEGEFEQNPFDQSFVYDIEIFVLDDAKISIEINWDNFDFSSGLDNISNNFQCDYKQALKIFIEEFKPDIKKIIVNNKLQGEVYVKLISRPELKTNNVYWYVSLVGKSGQTMSVVIDPYSKQVLAKNLSSNSLYV